MLAYFIFATIYLLAASSPLIVIFFVIKNKKINYFVKWATSGWFLGLWMWLYDYDFLLNPGGPSTAISDYIKDTIDFSPFLILTLGLAFFCFLISIILKKLIIK